MSERYRSLIYYEAMVADRVRTGSYRQAISEVVQAGDTVLDLGTGLGLLACFASQAGARQVYAIEATDAVALAQQVAEENGCHNISFVHAWSTEVNLPEPVDCIVTETLGGLALDENILRHLADAHQRFLKPGGRLVPERLRLWIAAVESEAAYAHVAYWQKGTADLRFRAVAQRAAKTPFMVQIPPEDLLSEPLLFREIDLYGDLEDSVEIRITMVIRRPGLLHGWVGWFEAQLTPTVSFGTGPTDPPTHWEQVFFPNVVPTRVRPGEAITLRLQSVPRSTSLLWYWELI